VRPVSAARLSFALLLKFFAAHGRFPRGRSELPSQAVEFVARQLQISASDPGFTSGRGVASSATARRFAKLWAFGSAP
jgi:hypothetical protein